MDSSPRGGGWRQALTGLLCASLLWGGTCMPGFAGEISKEYQVKAAFLYNFTKFVEWPSGAWAAKDDAIVIGVFGRNPFGAELENTVRDRKVHNRRIVVRSVQTAEEAAGIHLLFVPFTDDHRAGEMLAQLRGKPVLTVGESEPFARRDGMIVFVLDDDKVRFEINMDAADRAALKISAQLQKLAKTIRRK